MQDRTDLLESTLDALAHLVCGDVKFDPKEKVDRQHTRWHSLPSAVFDGFELYCEGDEMDENDAYTYVLQAASATDQPIWPLDVCVSNLNPKEHPEGSWQFNRIRTLHPAPWRGKSLPVMPRMVEHLSLTAQPDGAQVTFRVPYALVGTKALLPRYRLQGHRHRGGLGRWENSPAVYGTPKRDRDDEARVNNTLQLCAGLALRRHYLWSVLLGEGDGPRARFVTDPVGIREVFRLRDIPPGVSRRAALLHWVRGHWRKRRDMSRRDRAWVERHIRGAWSYNWNGLRCQIEPAAADLDELVARAGGR